MNGRQLGPTIERARIRRRLTQAELAEKLEVSRITVARWEEGVHLPADGSLMGLAAVLGLRLTHLQRLVKDEKWQRREERLGEAV